LALYAAYLDEWPLRQRIWPWVTAVVGLVVSAAGNVGHVEPQPGLAVTLTDRLTAAASPIAAFAGLMIGLLVLKMNRRSVPIANAGHLEMPPSEGDVLATTVEFQPVQPTTFELEGSDDLLVADASQIILAVAAHASGIRLSQRALAARLRERGHHFPNSQLRDIATAAATSIELRTA
jgi:hypothetical protein